MKKKLLLVACVLLLTGCAEIDEHDINVTPTVESVQMKYSDFNLVMDSKTGIVYIDNCIRTGTYDEYVKFTDRWHIYTPYYGKNGRLCKFVDGKVVEIEK